MIIQRFSHNQSPDFWLWLGPVFADPSIGIQFCNKPIGKLGGERHQMYTSLVSTPNFTWWLATIGTELAGFCAAEQTKIGILFTYAYVYPGNRRLGFYRQLFERRLDDVLRLPDVERIYSYPNDRSRKMFEEHNFTISRDHMRRMIAVLKED